MCVYVWVFMYVRMSVSVCAFLFVCMLQCTCGDSNVSVVLLFHDSGYQLRVADFHLEKNGSALVAACDYRFVPLPSSHVT